MKGHAALTSSERMDWATPLWLFDLLHSEFNFELDAAASAANAKCLLFWTEQDDALIQPWLGPSNLSSGAIKSVFCNPPYGRGIGAWMAKAKAEVQAHEGTIIMLVPARPDTSWWSDNVVEGATEVRFIKGRIQFEGAESGATFPSVVVVYTSNPMSGEPQMRHWDAKSEAAERGMTMAKRKTISTKKSKTDPVSINEEGVVLTDETDIEQEAVATAADPFGFGGPPVIPTTNGANGSGNGHAAGHAASAVGTVGTNLMGTPLGLGVGGSAFTPAVGGIQTSAPAAKIEPFNSMKANLKGLTGDVALAPLMAVCGGNRRGKTATRVAFEMAITGKAPGCVHAQDFMEYAPEGSSTVESMLISTTGSAHFEVKDGKKPADKPEYFGALKVFDNAEARERALPSVTMKSFLVGDVKARRAIFQRFGAGVVPQSGVPMPKGLNSDQTLFWRATVEEIAAEKSDAAEILSEMNRVMASKKLALGKEATAASKQLEEAKAKLAEAAAGAELIPQLEEQYKQAIAYENLESTRRQLQMAEQELANLETQAQEFVRQDGELTQWGERYTQLEQVMTGAITDAEAERQKIADDAALIAPKLKRVAAVDEILGAMIQAGVHACPVCEGQANPAALRAKIAGILQERMTGHEQLQAHVRTIDQNITTTKDRLAQEKTSYDRAKTSHETRRGVLKGTAATTQARIQALQQALAAAPSVIAESSESIKAKIETLRATEAMRTLVGQLETTIREKRNDQAIAKVLEKEAETLLQGLLEKAAGGAETAVNKYMPPGFTAKLDLEGGGCEWRSLGADGRPHNRHTMCGAEKSSLLVALALAWTEGAPARFLTLDDDDLGPFHSSPENLQALLGKIKDAVTSGALTQAMVCGVRKDEVPEGWLVIER